MAGWGLGFVLGAIGAACAWLLAEFVGRPFRQFFDLRREVSRRLVQFDKVMARAKMTGDVREPIVLSPEENARLTEAQETFRDLASQMRAFVNAEYFANRIVSFFGFDAYEASTALIGFSNEISTYGERRAHYRVRVESLLRIRSDE